MRRRHATSLIVLALLAAVPAGCGNDRQHAQAVPPPARPEGRHEGFIPTAGVRFFRPQNWLEISGSAPMVTISSGPATIAMWRYPRSKGEQLPNDEAELGRARKALVAASKARDRTLKVISSGPVTVGKTKGVEVVALERIGSRTRRVRSTHLYAYGAELVIDAYAPPSDFARVDRTVFEPLTRSLQITRPQRL